MATLYEYYNTGDSNASNVYGVSWEAQTFTPTISHYITSVKLLIYRSGSGGSPGTFTVSIRAISAGAPTGADLTIGTTNGNTLTTDTAGEWREIALTSYLLDASTMYAIVFRATAGDINNRVSYRFDDEPSGYSGGRTHYSNDSGATWDEFGLSNDDDILFEDWGNPLVAFIPQVTIM